MLAGIASVLVTVLAGIYTALLLPALQHYLNARAAQYARQREEAKAQQHAVNLTYLNPLRLWLEETYIRLRDIASRLEQGHCDVLLTVHAPAEVSAQEARWFNEEGCYLISSCYVTACLFFTIKQLRDNVPYLRLSRQGDTELMTHTFAVSQAFLQDLGIYYVIQPSIGTDVYLASQQRLMTYREFCQLLQCPERRVWCDRLLQFYLDVGQQQRAANVAAVLRAIRHLSCLLDQHIGQGSAIAERLQAEDVEDR